MALFTTRTSVPSWLAHEIASSIDMLGAKVAYDVWFKPDPSEGMIVGSGPAFAAKTGSMYYHDPAKWAHIFRRCERACHGAAMRDDQSGDKFLDTVSL